MKTKINKILIPGILSIVVIALGVCPLLIGHNKSNDAITNQDKNTNIVYTETAQQNNPNNTIENKENNEANFVTNNSNIKKANDTEKDNNNEVLPTSTTDALLAADAEDTEQYLPTNNVKYKFSGHRGCQTYGPENSIASFRAAEKRQMWAIETDFRMSKDKQVVCIHDDKLDRTVNHKGYVKDFTLKQLRDMEVKAVNVKGVEKKYNYSKLSHHARQIPTMEEYFMVCSRSGCLAFIELKEDGGVIDQMMEMIKKYDMEGKCIVSSSQMELLDAYRAKGGKDQVHLIFGTTDDFDHLLELGNAGLSFRITDLNTKVDYTYKSQKVKTLDELVNLVHELGMKVCFRAVDDQAALERSIQLGIDYFPTNKLW